MKTVPQVDEATVKRWAKEGKHAEIDKAREEGRLAVLLGGQPPVDPTARLSVDDVKKLAAQGRHQEINRAREAGLIDMEA